MKSIVALVVLIMLSPLSWAQHVTSGQHCELGSYDHSGSMEMVLDHRPEIALVSRSYYAPFIQYRGFTDRRMAFSVDGMHLLSANPYFTDPVTSYFEMTNLSSVDMDLSDNGPVLAGIGDGMDIKLRPAFLEDEKMIVHKLEMFGQSNGLGEGLRFSRDFSNATGGYYVSFTSNKAHAFTDGRGVEIENTQFEKRNFYGAGVRKLKNGDKVRANLVYDVGHNQGFVSTPIDIDISTGATASLSYRHYIDSLNHWQFIDVKGYGHWYEQVYSNANRELDSLSIRGYGESRTFGLNIKAERRTNHGKTSVRVSAWQDQLYSSEDRLTGTEESLDYHLWPLVESSHLNFFLRHRYKFSSNSVLVLSTSAEGLTMNASTAEKEEVRRMLSGGLLYRLKLNHYWTLMPKADYKERALTQHEAYANHIINARDNYEYLGNESLLNENAMQFELTALRKSHNSMLKFDAFYWSINNFINGVVVPGVIPRSAESSGVKQFESIGHVTMLGLEMEFEKEIGHHWEVHGSLSGLYSKDEHGHPLPDIPAEELVLGGEWHNDRNAIGWIWHTQYRKEHIREGSGELHTAGYSTFDFIYDFTLHQSDELRVSGVFEVDNVLNADYVPFLNYGGFSNPGRNIRLSLHLEF